MNQTILDWAEELGGGYVWESEIFAITLEAVPLSDDQALRLAGLKNVDQIFVNAERLTEKSLQSIATITGLRSLVISGRTLTGAELDLLTSTAPQLDVVELA